MYAYEYFAILQAADAQGTARKDNPLKGPPDQNRTLDMQGKQGEVQELSDGTCADSVPLC